MICNLKTAAIQYCIIAALLSIVLLCGCSSFLEQIAAAKDKYDNSVAVSEDSQKFADLDFCWGAFNGSSATMTDAAQIHDLRVTDSGLSYSWSKGGCEDLGADNRTSADSTLACLFCLIDGKWRGGKFDWISTSRTTRDFHNINTGYKGWDSAAINKATAYRFVIIDKTGKLRTNVIEVQR